MNDFIIREYTRADKPALIKLWNQAFGDSEALVEKFFDLLPKMGAGLLAETEGELAGMAFALRGMDLVSREGLIPCGYIYAVATEEKFRGRGIGAALSRATADFLKNWHAKLITTLPAEASLYPWYEKLLGVKPVLYRKTLHLTLRSGPAVKKARASDYLFRREQLLAGSEYLSVSLHVMEFQRLLCEEYGGGLYMGEDFVGFGYLEDGTAHIKELICPKGDIEAAASAIAFAMGAEDCVLYRPDTEGEPYIAATGAEFCTTCIWNVSFD